MGLIALPDNVSSVIALPDNVSSVIALPDKVSSVTYSHCSYQWIQYGYQHDSSKWV